MTDLNDLAGPSQPLGSAFLADVVTSLRRRRKALRHEIRELRIERIIERGDDGAREKLEIHCGDARRLGMRLFVWDDRWLWFDAREGSKADGWLWEYTRDGRLFGDDPGRRLVKALEDSIAATFELSRNDLARLARIWTPLLARGPRET